MEEVIKVTCVCGEEIEALVGIEHNHKDVVHCENCNKVMLIVVLEI